MEGNCSQGELKGQLYHFGAVIVEWERNWLRAHVRSPHFVSRVELVHLA